MVVVVLPDPFREMEVQSHFAETQQSGHALWSEPAIKYGRSSVKDGVPERLRYGEIQKEVN